jgi:predicted transcriptional regulator
MTILRRIMALPTEAVGQVPQIGIDDFAFRRGRKFGTIIVDLQTHKVLDVLPDRTADTSAAWMAAHPEIELVSRDRGGDYAAAARKAVPHATQTADRFHLLKNLGEALEGVLARHLAARRKRQTETAKASHLQASQAGELPKVIPKSVALSQAKREQRLAQYQQVLVLREQGFSQTAIAEQVGISHSTVSRWLSHGTFPEQQPRPRSTSVDPYLPQLVDRWKEGLDTVAELHRELVAEGYSHQYNSVYRRLVRSFPEGQKKRCTRSLPAEKQKQEISDQSPRPPVLASPTPPTTAPIPPASPEPPTIAPIPPAQPGRPSDYEDEAEVEVEQEQEVEEEKKPSNPEQEREAILKMIAEGRITPEEGDMLLEALGS